MMAQIRAEEEKIARCSHDFEKSQYDPEEGKEWVFDHYEGHGSDPYPVGHYIPKTIPRWSRACKHCGKKEYAYDQKPIVKGYEPDFK